MSAKLIIFVNGRLSINGHKMREFKWNDAHGSYIYEGAEISAEDFNAKYEKAMRNNADLRPRVKVVSFAGMAVAPVAAPITTISAREVTVEDAVAVLARLAPDKLKKRTGPKPRLPEEVAV